MTSSAIVEVNVLDDDDSSVVGGGGSGCESIGVALLCCHDASFRLHPIAIVVEISRLLWW
jgi:hypothetical protein